MICLVIVERITNSLDYPTNGCYEAQDSGSPMMIDKLADSLDQAS
jgi:hypothetical protein